MTVKIAIAKVHFKVERKSMFWPIRLCVFQLPHLKDKAVWVLPFV